MGSHDNDGSLFQSPKDELENTRIILKAIFDSIQSSIFLVAPDYRIIFFNKHAMEGSKLLFSRELFVGDSILNYRQAGDESVSDGFKKNFQMAIEKNSPVVTELEMHYPGYSFWIRSEYTPVFDKAKLIGVLLHVQNISDRKKFETETEQQQRQLDQIAWSQSHETRQPLASLLGLINILDRKSLTPENLEIIDLMVAVARKLEDVIQKTVRNASQRPAGSKSDLS